ncbi:MAG: aspartyl protease family protein [Pseudomonadota bacterium]|nr:aspartyl protease family protein [Pseudomonadota bacterium]
MFRIALAGLLFLVSFAAQAAEPIARLPYRFDYGGWFTVSATVNGQGPYDFIIDTGSSHSLVFENLAEQQHFPPSGGPQQTVLGLVSSGKYPTYKVGDIALGAAVLENAVTVILTDWKVDERSPQGVIGLDFLKHYRAVFDGERRELLLYRAGDAIDPAYEAWDEVSLTASDFSREAGYLYTLEARLNRASVRFLLDLGAAGTVVNRLGYSRAMQSEVSIKIAPRTTTTPIGRVTDALDNRVRAQSARINKIRTGKINWGAAVVIVHDASIFSDLGVVEEPFGLFGADMFRDRSFVLDFAAERILVGPKARKNS